MIADLRAAEIPVVALWYGANHPFPTVSVDNRVGVREALTHLSSLGHRRIAFVGGGKHGDIRERLAAYKEYLASAEIPLTRGYVRQGPNTINDGGLALSALLALPRPPTAILAATDVVALGLIHAAYEQAVAVPEQLSIVGFDDIPLAAATVPGLTTVKMPTAEMIAWAVELAVGAAGSPFHAAGNPPSVVFQPKLIVRRSTAEAPPDAQTKAASVAPRTRSAAHSSRAAVTRPRA
jgi:DNA-binding LacI/PurR family transcriptional regulator